MNKAQWRRQHKWSGIISCFFLLMFSVSGIILNHRQAVSDIDVSRSLLPGRYSYSKWNGGLLRGSVRYVSDHAAPSVLVYGNSGIWLTDSTGRSFADFNRGLPAGADNRQVRGMVQTADSTLFAATIFDLYRYDAQSGKWLRVSLPRPDDEKLTDVATDGKTLVVAGRSNLYVSEPPFKSFRKVQIAAPADYVEKVTLFRTIWTLHSGALFGLPGRIFVDIIGVIFIFLSITGIICWLVPKHIRRKALNGVKARRSMHVFGFSSRWHRHVGAATIVLTMAVVITGWCLRPPVLVLLALNKVPTMPGTTLHSDNPWNDKLRMVRFDESRGDWLLSTSEGFYALSSPDGIPVKQQQTPPVSVMGLNVMQPDGQGRWLCGSFSGMYVWDRGHGISLDYFTGQPVREVSGPPFGKRAVSGYSRDFGQVPVVVEYHDGTDVLEQPVELSHLPMSLWALALEIHNGRIYFGPLATYVFVFLAGLIFFWCLLSGWKMRKPRSK